MVGFDIGARHVRAAVLETSLRGFSVVELIEERILAPAPELRLANPAEGQAISEGATDAPPEAVEEAPAPLVSAAVVEAIQRILQRPGFEHDALSATLPEGLFAMTALELPFSGDKEIRAVLAPQLDGKLAGDVDELHLDYMRSGKLATGGWRIFAGGVGHDAMSELLMHWEDAGASPRVLEVQPFNLFTASEWALGSSAEQARAIIDLGANFTRVIIARRGEVEIARVIPGGAEDLTQRLAQALSLDEDAAREIKHQQVHLLADESASADAQKLRQLAEESLRPLTRDLRRTLAAHASTSETPVAEIYICGGGAALQGMEAWLSQSLGAPVQRIVLQREELRALPNVQAIGHRFVGALGAALRLTSTTPTSTFNLRRGPWAFRGAYEYITSRLPALAMMAAMLILSFAFFMFARNALMKAEFAATEAGLAELSRQVLGAEVTDPMLVRARIERGVDGPGLHPEVSAYDMVVRVSKAAQTTVDGQMPMELTAIDIDMTRRQAKVTGVCDSANIAETFGRNLGQDSCLQNVQRSSLTQRSSDSKFEFSFSATVNCREIVAPAGATASAETEAVEE